MARSTGGWGGVVARSTPCCNMIRTACIQKQEQSTIAVAPAVEDENPWQRSANPVWRGRVRGLIQGWDQVSSAARWGESGRVRCPTRLSTDGGLRRSPDTTFVNEEKKKVGG